jgi:hypothetical protein
MFERNPGSGGNPDSGGNPGSARNPDRGGHPNGNLDVGDEEWVVFDPIWKQVR